MKRRLASLATTTVMAVAGLVATATPAEARDTPGCVTQNEYFTVYRHHTLAKVHDHFDTAGIYEASHRSNRGYDVLRSYRKCRGFDGGHGRVGVLFDNYTAANAGYFDGRLRLYSKSRYNPYRLIWW